MQTWSACRQACGVALQCSSMAARRSRKCGSSGLTCVRFHPARHDAGGSGPQAVRRGRPSGDVRMAPAPTCLEMDCQNSCWDSGSCGMLRAARSSSPGVCSVDPCRARPRWLWRSAASRAAASAGPRMRRCAGAAMSSMVESSKETLKLAGMPLVRLVPREARVTPCANRAPDGVSLPRSLAMMMKYKNLIGGQSAA